MSEQSVEIGKLAAALAKAQGKITGALKDSANPFFKSKYADLAACWDSCRAPLSENGLAVIQTTAVDEQGVTVYTTLAHESGEWIRGTLRMLPKDGSPQSCGSALTYARRYALAAMVGLAQVDDDANAASGRATLGADPRGEEHKKVDQDLVQKWTSRVADIINCDQDEHTLATQIYAAHLELNKDSDLYIAVADALAKDGILTKAALRALVGKGKPMATANASGRAQ